MPGRSQARSPVPPFSLPPPFSLVLYYFPTTAGLSHAVMYPANALAAVV